MLCCINFLQSHICASVSELRELDKSNGTQSSELNIVISWPFYIKLSNAQNSHSSPDINDLEITWNFKCSCSLGVNTPVKSNLVKMCKSSRYKNVIHACKSKSDDGGIQIRSMAVFGWNFLKIPINCNYSKFHFMLFVTDSTILSKYAFHILIVKYVQICWLIF